jgi:hypothetical protein
MALVPLRLRPDGRGSPERLAQRHQNLARRQPKRRYKPNQSIYTPRSIQSLTPPRHSRHNPPRKLRLRHSLRPKHRIRNSKHNNLRLRAQIPNNSPNLLAHPPNNDNIRQTARRLRPQPNNKLLLPLPHERVGLYLGKPIRRAIALELLL